MAASCSAVTPGRALSVSGRGQLFPDHGVELTAQLCGGGIDRRFSALHLRLARFRLLKRHGADLTKLIAQLHFLDRAVKRRILSRQRGGLVLEREKAYIQRFTRRQKRSLRVAELADEVGVVLLELALLDVVEGLAQGVVALCKGLIGVALTPVPSGSDPTGPRRYC